MANRYDFSMPLDYGGFRDNSSSIANRYNPFWDAEANTSFNDIVKGNITSNASNLQRQNFQVVPHAVSVAPSYAMHDGHLADPVKKPNNADEFVKTYLPYAQKVEEAYGIPAPLVLAQAAHETGYGKALRDNNFFGIKGTGTAGSNLWNTHEYENGTRMNVKDKFAGYGTVEDSFNAYGKLISGGKRYRDAMGNIHDPRAYFNAIQGAGYATDPDYANKVYEVYKGVMRRLG